MRHGIRIEDFESLNYPIAKECDKQYNKREQNLI